VKAALTTLGCKVNHYETEAMRELFTHEGWQIVDFSEPADVYVVNTCTVTQTSDAKSRQMIARAHRMNPDALVVAVGCYAQVAPESVAALEASGSSSAPVDERRSFPVVNEALVSHKRESCVVPLGELREFEPFPPYGIRARAQRSKFRTVASTTVLTVSFPMRAVRCARVR
jgi:threonylcarbamoyladenosine tRNA methylthiotransferase MtaB